MKKSILQNLRRFSDVARQYRRRSTFCQHPPVRLWIEPTNACNLRCIMCPTGIGNTQEKGFISLDLYRGIIDEAATFAVDINLFGRGEAFLHPDLPALVSYAHDRGLNTRLESNATLLTPENSEMIIKAGLDFMSFSIDGYTKETYEGIRRGAEFEKTISNVVTFLETKKRLRSRKPYTSIQFIQTPAFLSGSTGKDWLNFRRIFRNLPLNTYRRVIPHRYVGEISEQVTGTRYGYMRDVAFGNFLIRRRYTPCPYPWTSMHILWDGTVEPCCMDFHCRYVVGRAGSSSLLKLWNSEKMAELREKLGSRRHAELNPCSGCDILYQRSLCGISTKNIKDLTVFIRENLMF